MKSNFQKLKPKVMTYKYFKTFSYDTFREYLFFKLMMKTFAVNFTYSKSAIGTLEKGVKYVQN